LLWGLRGGGGNFGVVTSLEFRLHPLGRVLGGIAAHLRDRARDMVRFFRAYCADAPDELALVAVFFTSPEGHPAVGIGACFSGPPEEAERVIKPLREYGPPLIDRLAVMPYTVLQSMMDMMAPPGLFNYWKADFMAGLSDRAIDLMIEQANAMRSPLSQIHIHQLGGAMSRVAPEATAFQRRDAGFIYNLIGQWRDPTENEVHTQWAKRAFEMLRPVSLGSLASPTARTVSRSAFSSG
jgi:hypothetical protein